MAIPGGTHGLGDILQDWLKGIPPWSWQEMWQAGFDKRRVEVVKWFVVTGVPLMKGRHWDWAWQAIMTLVYMVFGVDPIGIKTPVSPGPSFFDDPVGEVKRLTDTIQNNKNVADLEQFIGSLTTDRVMAVVRKYADMESPDPRAFENEAQGMLRLPTVIGVLLEMGVEVASAGQIRGIGQLLMNLESSSGMQHMMNAAVMPLFRSGIQPKLDRFYNRQYHPERFSAAQISDLFALGKRSADEVRAVLRDTGWRDEDIQAWIDLSYRTVSESDLWTLYHAGQVAKPEMDARLRALGYRPEDMALVYKANPGDEAKGAKDVLLSTAKSAYKNDLISESDFRRILQEQKYVPQEIELQLQLLNLQRTTDESEFNRGEIRILYSNRVIARPEAESYLTLTGMTASQAGLLVSAWDKADSPAPVRINQATIREAFYDGVLTREESKKRLTEVGYDSPDAELMVKTWEIESLPRVAAPGPRGAGALTLGQIADLIAAGLLNRAEALARPELERYAEADRLNLVELMVRQPATQRLDVSQSVLVEAYRLNLLTRADFYDRLLERGLSAEDAELTLVTIDAQLAEEAAGITSGTLKRPSVGALQLALQRGLLTVEEFRSILMNLGFNDDAIAIYSFNAQYQAPAKPQALPRTTVLDLYVKGKIGRADTQYRLVGLGYTVKDAQLLIEAEMVKPEDSEVAQAYLAGYVSEAAAGTWLLEAGFSAAEIQVFFRQYPAAA
jgi:hypothetical protein